MTTKELRKTIKDTFGPEATVYTSGDPAEEGWTIRTPEYTKPKEFILSHPGLEFVRHDIVGSRWHYKHEFWVYPKEAK